MIVFKVVTWKNFLSTGNTPIESVSLELDANNVVFRATFQ